jgi:hypothetical protein
MIREVDASCPKLPLTALSSFEQRHADVALGAVKRKNTLSNMRALEYITAAATPSATCGVYAALLDIT